MLVIGPDIEPIPVAEMTAAHVPGELLAVTFHAASSAPEPDGVGGSASNVNEPDADVPDKGAAVGGVAVINEEGPHWLIPAMPTPNGVERAALWPKSTPNRLQDALLLPTYMS